MEKDLICKFKHYEISGTAKIRAWGGAEGFTKINPSTTDNIKDLSDLKKFVNDGGFGCESILSAHLNITNIYEHGAKIFNREEYVMLDEHVSDADVMKYEDFEFNN